MSEIRVTKLTDVDLLRKANSFTTGRDSKMSLRRAYQYGHTPIRTQLFFIEMEDIPLFCASQFVRSKVGVEWWQRSKRTDRGGEDFYEVCHGISREIHEAWGEGEYSRMMTMYHEINELPDRFDRFSPTSLAGLFNAEAIINMSHKRLCMKASTETREIWKKVLSEGIANVDPDLYQFCVMPCVNKGFCSEPKSCGWCGGKMYGQQRNNYLKLFENE